MLGEVGGGAFARPGHYIDQASEYNVNYLFCIYLMCFKYSFGTFKKSQNISPQFLPLFYWFVGEISNSPEYNFLKGDSAIYMNIRIFEYQLFNDRNLCY